MFILRFLPRSLCHLVTRPARAVRVTHLKLLVWLIILFVVNRLKIKRWWFLRKVPVQFNLNFKVKRNNNKGFELEIFSSVEDGKVVWDSLLLPWVPKVFLACGENFRCRGTSSAVSRSHERRSREKNGRVTIKTWQKPETALEKSLAPRVAYYMQNRKKTLSFLFQMKTELVNCLQDWG